MTKKPPADEAGIEILEIVGISDVDVDIDVDVEQSAATDVDALPPRMSKMRAGARLDGVRQVLRELLPALDDLENCVRKGADRETMEEGVRLGLRQMWDVFRVHGLERIEGTGQRFDPAMHDAGVVTQTDRVPSNTVLEVLRVGYFLAGELVRPALVRVSTPVEEEELIDERFRGTEGHSGEEQDR